MGFPFRRRKRGISEPGAAPDADQEERLVIDAPGPSYLRAERDDTWSLAISWRGLLFATLLLAGLAVVAVVWE